jgi:hypothetical protein
VGKELKTAFKVFKGQELPAYRSFIQKEPLLQAAQPVALKQLSDIGLFQPSLLKTYQTQVAPVMLSGGALTPSQQTAAEQQSLSLAARAGMATGPQGIASAVLNTEQARQQRFNTALTQGLSLAGGYQTLSQDALKSVYGGELAQTGAFGGLVNPILNYAGDVANTNYNAQAAANIQGANASAAGKGGTMGMIGSIAGAAGAAY